MAQWVWVTTTPTELEQLVSILNKRMKALEGKLASVDALQNRVGTFTDGDTTPSVDGVRLGITANTSATSITTFDNGAVGQHITIRFGDTNTTLVHGSNLTLIGQANFTGINGSMKQFATSDGTAWREVPQDTVWA